MIFSEILVRSQCHLSAYCGSASSTSVSGSTETDSIPKAAIRDPFRTFGKTKVVYRCGRCGFVTEYKGNLAKHLKSQHQGKTSGANRQDVKILGGKTGPEGGEAVPESGGAVGGSLPDGGGTVGEARGDSRNDASGNVSGDELGDKIISDEDDEDPDDSKEVDGHGNPVLRNPFKRPPSQPRERGRK